MTLQSIEEALLWITSIESVKIVTAVTSVSSWILQLSATPKKLRHVFFTRLTLDVSLVLCENKNLENYNKYNVYYDATSQKFKCSPNQSSCAENVCACDTEFVNS